MDAARPLISVVMPCFNAEAHVEAALRSALQQSYGPVELVVIDDGSTDRSAAIVAQWAERFPGRIELLSGARSGPYPARNRGLARARGELIAFLDADDYWEPDFLQSTADALQASQADIAYCGWQNVGPTGPLPHATPGSQPYVPPAYEDGDPVEHFLRGCPWPIHAALVRRSLIDRAGGFSERLFTSMDYDLWIRLLALSPGLPRMVRVPRVLAYYRWHGGGQISALKSRQLLHAWQVRRDFVAANPDRVRHLGAARRRALVDGELLEQGKVLFWRRDLAGAQALLRPALLTGAWRLADLPLLGAAQLPARVFERLVGFVDARAAS